MIVTIEKLARRTTNSRSFSEISSQDQQGVLRILDEIQAIFAQQWERGCMPYYDSWSYGSRNEYGSAYSFDLRHIWPDLECYAELIILDGGTAGEQCYWAGFSPYIPPSKYRVTELHFDREHSRSIRNIWDVGKLPWECAAAQQ